MAAKNLSVEEMTALSSSWLDERRHRSVFMTCAMMAGLVPSITEAHEGVLSIARAPGPEAQGAERELAAVQAEALEADRLHDRKGGGAHAVLEGLEQLADTPEEAQRYAAMRQRLFPAGPQVLGQTYLAEAGNAERVEKELADKSFRDALARVKVGEKRTLLDEARAFVKAGRSLGVLEARKGALAASPAEGGASRFMSSRNAWVQVANVVLTTAKLLKGDDAERFAPVLREFRAAEAKADERAARRRKPADETGGEHADEPSAPGKTGNG